MSFDGFSDVEIQKMTKGRSRKPDGKKDFHYKSSIDDKFELLVKLAKNIPCHTKVKQVASEKDENQNRTFAKPEIEEVAQFVEVQLAPIELPIVTNGDAAVCQQPEVEIKNDRTSKKQDFELHRKLMEEQNKMKRNLLQEAISKHAEKTQAEAKKLNEIKHALDLLDSELATDVSILRKQIESATLHFNTQERNYCAIERSFLKAKQDLYQAHEKKELLTEHLYTIIAHNEDRKAKRLSELMEKVGLTLNENGT